MSTDDWTETTEPDACRACGSPAFHCDAHSHLCSGCGAYHGPAMRPRYGYTVRARMGATDAIGRALCALERCFFWLSAPPMVPCYSGADDVRDAAGNHRLALAQLDNAIHTPARCAPGRHWYGAAPECCICGERLEP